MTSRPMIASAGELHGRKSPKQPWTLDYLLERSMPEPNSGCWLWTGAQESNGYGVVRHDGRSKRAHRFSFELAKGITVPRNLDVCHHCDTRLCVNPDHLFVGTRADNMRDCANKGRIRVPALAGDASPNSKLTSEKARLIRADTRPHRLIAASYGVVKSTIGYIKRGRTWR